MTGRGHSGSNETGDNKQFITPVGSGSCTEVMPIMTLYSVQGKVQRMDACYIAF